MPRVTMDLGFWKDTQKPIEFEHLQAHFVPLAGLTASESLADSSQFNRRALLSRLVRSLLLRSGLGSQDESVSYLTLKDDTYA